MNKDYATHWVIGLLATVVWFWGDKAGVPPTAITLAASLVPAAIAHALAYTPSADTTQYDPPPAGLSDDGGASKS